MNLSYKTCSRCKIKKPFSEFNKRKDRKIGIFSQCKRCDVERRKEYYSNNPKGYLFKTYHDMRIRVRGRNRYDSAKGRDILDKDIFVEWSLNDKKFIKLFTQYKKNRQLKNAPSIDRIDNNKGYSLDNIQWLTFSENSKKSDKER